MHTPPALCPYCHQPLLPEQAHACAAGEEKDPIIAALRTRGLDRVWWGKYGHQQPIYHAIRSKEQGAFPGAVYAKDHTKPNSPLGLPLKEWMGKPGSYDINTTLDTVPRSAFRRGISRDVIKEKIAFDFYVALSHSCQDAYFVPKCRLAKLPILNQFTRENLVAAEMERELRQQSGRSDTPHLHIMSKLVPGYKDLKDAHVLDPQGHRLAFMDYFQQTQCFPDIILNGNEYLPLRGLPELFAASRLLGDIDVLGDGFTNAGYVITQNKQGKRYALIVKVDPGLAFSFNRQNRFWVCRYPNADLVAQETENPLADPKDIQFSNRGTIIQWTNFSTSQQTHFLRALQQGIVLLQQPSLLNYLIKRDQQFDQGAGEIFLKPELIQQYVRYIQTNVQFQQETYAVALQSLAPPSSKPLSPRTVSLQRQWEAQKQAELQHAATQHQQQLQQTIEQHENKLQQIRTEHAALIVSNSEQTEKANMAATTAHQQALKHAAAQNQIQLQHELQQLEQRLNAEKVVAVVAASEGSDKASAEVARHLAKIQDLEYRIAERKRESLKRPRSPSLLNLHNLASPESRSVRPRIGSPFPEEQKTPPGSPRPLSPRGAPFLEHTIALYREGTAHYGHGRMAQAYACFEAAAAQQYPAAYLWLYRILKNKYVSRNSEREAYFKNLTESHFSWFHREAQTGQADAQNNLGRCYENGMGVAKDEREAVRWYRLAAEQGYASAQDRLGWCYFGGMGVEKNPVEAVHWYRLAAEQRLASAQGNLGICYVSGTGVEKNPAEAVRWYRLAAEQGHASAQDRLGLCYVSGTGVEKNSVEAVRWFRLAAEQGHASAQDRLGWCYFGGTGVEKNPVEAVHWYRLAAEQGHAPAQGRLGLCYVSGTGVEKNPVEAVHWYRLAAEQGVAEAQVKLGVCYEDGTGVEKNPAEAVRWYRLAAEQGHASAQDRLGLCYVSGTGVEKNSVEAVRWFRLAAEQGYATAQHNIGVCYAKGSGVAKDENEAVRWYRMAAAQENKDAIAALKRRGL